MIVFVKDYIKDNIVYCYNNKFSCKDAKKIINYEEMV
jgi:hypothetical protein